MNLENFNLGKFIFSNETKNFISEFINELAKTLNKEKNMNIVEAFQKKLSISEKVYEKEHGGRPLSESKKIAIARVLANTSEYITEAFENSVGTQFSNMKTFKKFCLDLTTVALPSLIA